jgi:glutathione peroxidase
MPLLNCARWVALTACVWATSVHACPKLLQHQFERLQDGAPQSLCQYEGKVLLVVNTASYCGFTNQYKGLEALHKRYAARGLVVLGFPSNDFGRQEPGDAKQIADLCFNTYGVEFPMFAKTVVAGEGANAFYKQLAKASGSKPGWNFHKYLISANGQQVTGFDSANIPLGGPVEMAVQAALAGQSTLQKN